MKNKASSPAYLIVLATLTAVLLAGCGGGADPSPNNTNTNWDQLVWDQDDWR